MACNCNKNKYNMPHVIKLAKITVSIRKIDMQVYSEKEPTGRVYYDYEPLDYNRKDIVCYIPYSDFSHTA